MMSIPTVVGLSLTVESWQTIVNTLDHRWTILFSDSPDMIVPWIGRTSSSTGGGEIEIDFQDEKNMLFVKWK